MNFNGKKLINRKLFHTVGLFFTPLLKKNGYLNFNSSHYKFLSDDITKKATKTKSLKEKDVSLHNKLTPFYESIREIIEDNEGKLCLVQVGSFYEIYFDQALTYGEKLGLKVVYKKTNNHIIPMIGFPVFQLHKFVKILVSDFKTSVVLIDQINSKKKNSKLLVERKVRRIISSGTLTDFQFSSSCTNNFLLSILFKQSTSNYFSDIESSVGLSWIDLSVGDFYTQKIALSQLRNEIFRINPVEILISKDFEKKKIKNESFSSIFEFLNKYFITYHKTTSNDNTSLFNMDTSWSQKKIENLSSIEKMAMNMILSYIKTCFPNFEISINIPKKYTSEKFLQMDFRTRKSLELNTRFNSRFNSEAGSLLRSINKTKTISGHRLLKEWINSPILDLDEIKFRQNFVKIFINNSFLRNNLRNELSKINDIKKSILRLSLANENIIGSLLLIADDLASFEKIFTLIKNEYKINPDDLEPLRIYIEKKQFDTNLSSIILDVIDKQFINQTNFSNDDMHNITLLNDSDVLKSLSQYQDYLKKNFKKNPSTLSEDSFVVKNNYNAKISSLHKKLIDFKDQEELLFSKIKNQIQKVDANLLVVRKTNHNQYSNVIVISGNSKLLDKIYNQLSNKIFERKKQLLIYLPDDWIKLRTRIEDTVEKIKNCEIEVMNMLKLKVLKKANVIIQMNNFVSFIDITSSFAISAIENNLTCPQIKNEPQLKIIKGRHLSVESVLKNSNVMFTPNDININSKNKLWIITGPNMGGKSTFLRQNAIIIILSQIGSFVPAESAEIGIFDRIFTRIGSSDDISNNLSTFMIEMIETCNILQNATKKSFAVIDELGRGTSGKEGLVIAYSTLIHLIKKNECLTLFATHFGSDLSKYLDSSDIERETIKYFKTNVAIKSNEYKNYLNFNLDLIFDHKLIPGISKNSFALEIAKHAGFPESALTIAHDTLKSM